MRSTDGGISLYLIITFSFPQPDNINPRISENKTKKNAKNPVVPLNLLPPIILSPNLYDRDFPQIPTSIELELIAPNCLNELPINRPHQYKYCPEIVKFELPANIRHKNKIFRSFGSENLDQNAPRSLHPIYFLMLISPNFRSGHNTANYRFENSPTLRSVKP